MARASAAITVSDYAKGFSPSVRTIMSAARATVKSVAPAAKETAYRGWPTRYFDADGPVVAVGGYSRHAALYFFRALELDDPDDLLEGTGARLRHITLRTAEDARRPAVKRLIRRAFKLGGFTLSGLKGNTPRAS